MAGIANILSRRYHRRWVAALITVAVVAVAAIVCLILVSSGIIDASPWLYIALAAAMLAGLAGIVVTMLEAKFQGDTTSASARLDASRKIRAHHDHGHHISRPHDISRHSNEP